MITISFISSAVFIPEKGCSGFPYPAQTWDLALADLSLSHSLLRETSVKSVLIQGEEAGSLRDAGMQQQ